MKLVAVVARSLDDDHLGGQRRVVDLDDLGAPRRPPVGIVGHARRGRGLVERVHVLGEVAAGQFAGEPHPALRLARAWRCVPLDGDRGRAGEEDAGVVRPFVDREVEPVEVCPPERLVLAPVVAAGGGQQGDRGLFGCALAAGGVAGEGGQGRRQFVVVFDGGAARELVARQRE